MITGRCLCGDVTFHTDAVPIVTSTCWCRVRQYFGAGSGNANAGLFPEGEYHCNTPLPVPGEGWPDAAQVAVSGYRFILWVRSRRRKRSRSSARGIIAQHKSSILFKSVA